MPDQQRDDVADCRLALQGSRTSAAQIALTNGSISGTRVALVISGGAVTLDVSERPTFVLLDSTNTTDPVMSIRITLTPSMATNKSGLGNTGLLVDEHSLSADLREPGGGGRLDSYLVSRECVHRLDLSVRLQRHGRLGHLHRRAAA